MVTVKNMYQQLQERGYDFVAGKKGILTPNESLRNESSASNVDLTQNKKRAISFLAAIDDGVRATGKVPKLLFDDPTDKFDEIIASSAPVHELSEVQIEMLEDTANFRSLEDKISTEFLVILRSSHPALKTKSYVLFSTGRKCWSVEGDHTTPLMIGGFAVHLRPASETFWALQPMLVPGGRQSIELNVGYGRLPTNEEVVEFREFFKGSCGLRIMLGGFIEVLFPTKAAVRTMDQLLHKSYYASKIFRPRRGMPNFGFRFILTVLQIPTPTVDGPHQVTLHEERQSHWSGKGPGGCIGARILLHDKEYLTTVTHGLVKLQSRPSSRALSLWEVVKSFVVKYQRIYTIYPIPGSRLLGSPVFAASTARDNLKNRPVGTVSKSYDSIDRGIMAWPAHFTHDLSLIAPIAGEALPEPFNLGLPAIDDQFIRPETVWVDVDCHQCFVGGYTSSYGESLPHAGALEAPKATEALISGLEIKWTPEEQGATIDGLKRAFLWRTSKEWIEGHESMATGDDITVVGASGALICVGDPFTTKLARPLAFQNFEDAATDTGYKGGFFLPEEVLEAKVLWSQSHIGGRT